MVNQLLMASVSVRFTKGRCQLYHLELLVQWHPCEKLASVKEIMIENTSVIKLDVISNSLFTQYFAKQISLIGRVHLSR